MCTAATYRTHDFYFGRTLDYEFSYGGEVAAAPRNYPFRFRTGETLEEHYAMIGMAHVADGYPLYYDAVNEKGLGMAGLNFVGNAVYHEAHPERDNVDTFEFIPWILGRCATVEEARAQLGRLNLTGGAINAALPAAQLHWIIADKNGATVVESVKEGLRVYDNSAGVLAILHVDLSPVQELVSLQRRCANNLNQVATHANSYGVYQEEIKSLQKDYADLWGPLSDLLQKLSEVVRL